MGARSVRLPQGGVERQSGGGGYSPPRRSPLATISEEPSESLENEKGERFDTLTRDDVARTKGTSLEARQLAAEQTVRDIKSATRLSKRSELALQRALDESERNRSTYVCHKARRTESTEIQKLRKEKIMHIVRLRQLKQQAFEQQLALCWEPGDEFDGLQPQEPVDNPNYAQTEGDGGLSSDFPHDIHVAPQFAGLRKGKRHYFFRLQTEDVSGSEGGCLPVRESDELSLRPLYHVQALVGGYAAMQTTVEFDTGGGVKRSEKIIVDSGAANSAIGLDKLKKDYPLLCERMVPPPATLGFHDASGRPMPVAGVVEMMICIQSHCFVAEVIVFHKLGCNFLLGTNTIVSGGLVIDAADKRLYVKQSDCQAILDVGGPAKSVATTTLDRDRECLSLSIDGQPPIECLCSKTEGVGEQKLPERSAWKSELRCDGDVVIPPYTRNVGIRCTFVNHHDGAPTDLEIVPAQELVTCHPGLTTWRAQRHYSTNYHAFVMVSNTKGTPVKVCHGELVAQASVAGVSTDFDPDGEILAVELEDEEDLEILPFERGGPPRTREDLHALGFSLEEAIDPGKPLPEGGYAPLGEHYKDKIYAAAIRHHTAWSRDARVPRISKLVIIDIPTGNARPIQQKPYGIPRKYIQAVREEIDKLLKAGLIEPSLGNWSSPTLLTVKKDSTADKLKIKIVVDYRRVNEVTIADAGGLGNQQEIIDSFGGGRKFSGICDAAGGFYQYLLNPLHKERSTFILPTSMGGTTFQWRVAPYGLSRNPASYSRGMMFALQNMTDKALMPMGQSEGSVFSWIDDITLNADSMEGFIDLFEQMLMRVTAAGISLKGEKCWLLRDRLEVLGFLVCPDGLRMNPDKTDAITSMPCPKNVDEIRTYLGMVGFYRRFVPRLGVLAAPMFACLKKSAVLEPDKIRQSFAAINEYLLSEAVVHPPDFKDPNAAFALCPDASNVAAGAALMQWQHPTHAGPGPDETEGANEGKDELTQSWRHEKGWKLQTIGFFSKTFIQAQRNWPTFDKEAGAIVLAIRHWVDLITGHHTTVYTDSQVAASMLSSKHAGPPRLQRWGMELMTFLPYLRIAYRRGIDNGLADLLSRYPLFEDYFWKPEHEMEMPEDLYEKVGEAKYSVLPSKFTGYALWECKKLLTLDDIWQNDDLYQPHTARTLLRRAGKTQEDSEAIALMHRCSVMALKELAQQTQFHKEQRRFEEIQDYWQQYVSAFQATYGRQPVVYDLYCGEGCYSRGARLAGAVCFGFDNNGRYRHRYEREYSTREREPSGMRFYEVDLSHDAFWEELRMRGRYADCPAPDAIHASPPCVAFSRLTAVNANGQHGDSESVKARRELAQLLDRLHATEEVMRSKYSNEIAWQVENVQESQQYLGTQAREFYYTATLCGTMFGHQVFKHRAFYCNYPVKVEMAHNHEGKLLGTRGISFSLTDDAGRLVQDRHPNMYGVYSRPSYKRGTMVEWHGAMGHSPGTCTTSGIVGCLPQGYGRYLTAQMVAHVMNRRQGMPVVSAIEASPPHQISLQKWAVEGCHLKTAGVMPVPVSNRRYGEVYASQVAEPQEGNSVEQTYYTPWPAGTRIEVYWTGDKVWYSGTVKKVRRGWNVSVRDQRAKAWQEIEVLYDDGGTRTHDVWSTDIRRRRRLSSLPEEELTLDEREKIRVRQENRSKGDDEDSTDSEDEGDRDPRKTLDSAYAVTYRDQMLDPWSATLIRDLIRQKPNGPVEPDAPPPQRVEGNGTWTILHGLLCRVVVGADDEVHYQVAVPGHKREKLMAHAHYQGHRSGKELYEDLHVMYYWPYMETSCMNFKDRCKICGERASAPRPQVKEGLAPTPEHAFAVLHLDCKTGLPISGGYNRIVAATCALTRYTIYMPLSEGTGVAIFRALLEHVFKYFGIPKRIIVDNGTEFRNNLMAEMANYLGYRKVHVLPYSPQANGLAEAAIKRIKLLLDKNTVRYREWHKSLPMFMLLLNTRKHPGLQNGGMTPYYAVFGREAVRTPMLEGPEMPSTLPDGSLFLRTFHSHLKDVHSKLHAQSHEIRRLRQERRNAKLLAKPAIHPIREGDYVWMIFRDWERAAYMRKHGKGEPWKRRFLVLKVSEPYGVKLDVSATPGVLEWQPRRRIVPAPHELHGPEDLTPTVAPIGEFFAPGVCIDADALLQDDAESEDIEMVVKAESLSEGFEVTVKRVGRTEFDVIHYDEAVRLCVRPEIKAQLEKAITIAKMQSDWVNVDDADVSEDLTGQVFHVGTRPKRDTLTEMGVYYRGVKNALQAFGKGCYAGFRSLGEMRGATLV